MKSLLILGSVAAVIAVAPAAAAKSPAEIEQIAKAVSVEMITGVGSANKVKPRISRRRSKTSVN